MQNTTTSISYLHNNSNPLWSYQFTIYCFTFCNLWGHKSGVWVRMNVNAHAHAAYAAIFPFDARPRFEMVNYLVQQVKVVESYITYYNSKISKKSKDIILVFSLLFILQRLRCCQSVEHLQSLAQILCRSAQKDLKKFPTSAKKKISWMKERRK